MGNPATTKAKIFDNCKCLSKEGEHMFFCNERKAQSYLKKGIAEMVSNDPFTFRILFEPKGKGIPNQIPRKNECEVCMSTVELTKHHVIPLAFRKLMPLELKEHKSDDLVVLCETHHREYEISSRGLLLHHMEAFAKEIETRKLVINGIKAQKTLDRFGEFMSEERRNKLSVFTKYKDLPILSDWEILLKNYGPYRVADLWKEDFTTWMKNKTGKDFQFKK